MTRTRNQTSAAAPEPMAANRRKEPPARRLRVFAKFNKVDFMFFILSCSADERFIFSASASLSNKERLLTGGF
jgi:hypothetical protein